METGNPAEMWDIIVSQWMMQKSKPSGAKPSSSTPLRLNDTPKKVHLPTAERSIAEIAAPIRQAIRAQLAGEQPWPLVLFGPTGTGKTCAMLCLLDYTGGEYHTVSGLCSLMNRAAQERVEWSKEGRGGTLWPEAIWRVIAAAPLVVLDELGCRGNVSDAHYEVVKEMIDARHRKPLAVLSNLPLDKIGKLYDDRIFSRLSAGTVIELAGKDRRIEE